MGLLCLRDHALVSYSLDSSYIDQWGTDRQYPLLGRVPGEHKGTLYSLLTRNCPPKDWMDYSSMTIADVSKMFAREICQVEGIFLASTSLTYIKLDAHITTSGMGRHILSIEHTLFKAIIELAVQTHQLPGRTVWRSNPRLNEETGIVYPFTLVEHIGVLCRASRPRDSG